MSVSSLTFFDGVRIVDSPPGQRAFSCSFFVWGSDFKSCALAIRVVL